MTTAAMSEAAPIVSIATPLDRAWQCYRLAVAEALAHPTEAAVLHREAARKVWLALFLREREAA